MRHLLDLFLRNPLSRGEFLDESWQFYMHGGRKKRKRKRKIRTHFPCGKLKKKIDTLIFTNIKLKKKFEVSNTFTALDGLQFRNLQNNTLE